MTFMLAIYSDIYTGQRHTGSASSTPRASTGGPVLIKSAAGCSETSLG